MAGLTNLEQASTLYVVSSIQHLAISPVNIHAVPCTDEDFEDRHCEDTEEDVLHHKAKQHFLE